MVKIKRIMDYTEYLIEYGLTRQEATIYISLLKHGSMTGYEVSKDTGISKSNVYSALKGLTQKGAAVCEEHEATRYLPVEPKIFCDNHLRYLHEVRENIIKWQPKKAEITEGYITINSARNIKNKIYEMLDKCELRLYIMADSQVIDLYARELARLAEAGKKIVVLSDSDPKIKKATFYKIDNSKGQIRFVVDSGFVLTGGFSESDGDTCLYSRQENLVNLVKETIKSRMLLSEK